jgi:hypothetical protein
METGNIDLVSLTFRAVERLYTTWLEPYVQGLTIELAERKAYAQHLALTLQGELPCTCGRTLCPQQHTLAAFPGAGKTLESFVYRAVIGPVGCKTQSIAQGMLFPFLRREYGLQVALVAYKQCDNPDCGKQYEGATCPYCRTIFHPGTTAILGRERLVVAGERGYMPLHYWRCSQSQPAHFYPQGRCHDGGKHALVHDRCPWQTCPAGNPAHGQRSTTLWVRAKFLRPASATPHRPHILTAVAAGVQHAMAQCTGWERNVLRLLGDNAITIAETLLVNDRAELSSEILRRAVAEYPEAPTPQTIRANLARTLRPKVLQAIRHACTQRGVDLPRPFPLCRVA